MIIRWNENVNRKEIVNPNLSSFRDVIDKYAEACEDIPRTHNKKSFCERTHQRGKSEQKDQRQKEMPALFTKP